MQETKGISVHARCLSLHMSPGVRVPSQIREVQIRWISTRVGMGKETERFIQQVGATFSIVDVQSR